MDGATSRLLRGGRKAALAVVLACGACFASDGGSGRLRVEDAWAAATPPGAVTAAAYMTIESPAADRLVAARSSVSRGVELHTHVESGGLLRMAPMAALAVEPGVPAELAPGGDHLMLVGLLRPLVAGEEIVVELEFERAGTREIALPVRDLRTLRDAHDPAAGHAGHAASDAHGAHGAQGGSHGP